ncbi:uncharacterized protein [Physcomitrium patens]|nr:uncharacterized protein LOC112291522 isoform X2 [Physcomitrium patens]XP_024394832.1 uncharacterized protein LOC112291522 isoform X2 [Physcomitrium patens]PNR41155.1 hypothetical protein PHYPA_018558 [Physcomitrium patens]|eukprot:XP_024394831.1 uncharacterized protein LOC112291522 isoform X2 [Physcomitrella patens]
MTSQKSISSFFQAPKRLKVVEETAASARSKEDSSSDVTPTEENDDVSVEIAPPAEGKKKRKEREDNEEQEKPSTEVPELKDSVESQENALPEMTLEQKQRMEANKAGARAKRNLKTCEEHVANAKEAGVAFPKFSLLLVDESWLEVLREELQKQYMDKLYRFVLEEASGKFPIYPPAAKVFNAFNTCPFNSVKVVILGQDPYHGPGQAMGLSFSVPEGIKIPSSLVNIFKEIKNDVGCPIPKHGNLEKWAYQGVLLLNTVLTVRDHQANSHAKKGWEMFTDAAIRALSQQRKGIVFILWGNSAQEKTRLINASAHHILKTAHPSGLSANRGFFGCRHFSQTNKFLENAGQLPIDWQL